MISALRFLYSVAFSFRVVHPLFPFALIGLTVILSGYMSRKIEATWQYHSLKVNVYFSTQWSSTSV